MTRAELESRFKARAAALCAVKAALGPVSLTELAKAARVNRQTIINALARGDRDLPGPEPVAQDRFFSRVGEVCPAVSAADIAAILRQVADELTN